MIGKICRWTLIGILSLALLLAGTAGTLLGMYGMPKKLFDEVYYVTNPETEVAILFGKGAPMDFPMQGSIPEPLFSPQDIDPDWGEEIWLAYPTPLDNSEYMEQLHQKGLDVRASKSDPNVYEVFNPDTGKVFKTLSNFRYGKFVFNNPFSGPHEAYRKIIVAEGVTYVPEYCFCASGVRTLYIASSVTSFQGNALGGCDELRDVYFLGDAPYFKYPYYLAKGDPQITVHVRPGTTGWDDPELGELNIVVENFSIDWRPRS